MKGRVGGTNHVGHRMRCRAKVPRKALCLLKPIERRMSIYNGAIRAVSNSAHWVGSDRVGSQGKTIVIVKNYFSIFPGCVLFKNAANLLILLGVPKKSTVFPDVLQIKTGRE